MFILENIKFSYINADLTFTHGTSYFLQMRGSKKKGLKRRDKETDYIKVTLLFLQL